MDLITVEKDFPSKRIHSQAFIPFQDQLKIIFKVERITKKRLIHLSNKTSRQPKKIHLKHSF